MSEAPEPTADRKEIGRIILILAVCGFVSALSTRFVDPMIGLIARDLAADPLDVALLATAYALPYAFIQPVLGPVGDALGKTRIMKFLLAALAATLVAASLTSSLTALFAWRILSGAAAGAIVPMALATIGDRVEMRERQVAIGRFLTAAISGQLLGGVGSGLVSAYVGWRGAFAIAGGLSALATLAVAFGFRSTRVVRAPLSFAAAGRRYRQILGIPRAQALVAYVFAEGILVFGVQPYIAPLLERSHLGSAREAGLIIGGFAIGGILYTLLVRWLLATFGLGRMLKLAGMIVALAFGALAPALPWAMQAAAMMVVGLGFYMLHNSFQTQMTEVAPDARASAIALHAFGFFVGQALGPVIYGQALGLLGRAGAMSLCAIGVLVMGLLASRQFGETQPRPR